MAASEKHSNARTIRRLYAGIKAHDLDEIEACYADDASFTDIAFERRGKPEVMQMWQMICMKVKPEVTFDEPPELPAPTADAKTGHGWWRACYYFDAEEKPPGRRVDNRLTSTFRFRDDGLIVDHHDDCSVLRWALQAMPLPKALLAAAFPRQRQKTAMKKLAKFLKSLPPTQAARFASPSPARAQAPAPAPPPSV